MAGRILLFVAGLLIAACFACTPAMGPAPPGTHVAVCAYDRIEKLRVQGYTQPNGPSYKPDRDGPASAAMVADVQAAVALAPQFFRDRLCQLDAIFIAPSGESWGMRAWDAGNPTIKRYIALSADLWTPGGPPLRLSEYKDKVLHTLFAGWSGPNAPKYKMMLGDPSHDPAMTLLAVMAHEYGHVLFYDTFVSSPGSPPDFHTPAFCGGNFYKDSWEDASLPRTTIWWRKFTEIDGSHPPGDVQMGQIRHALSHPAIARGLLSRFFSGKLPLHAGRPRGRWASLLAAFTPDHDFVESFALFVLLNNTNSRAPLKSVAISIPGHPNEDIVATCDERPVLMSKLGCFQRAFCATGSGSVCGRVCP
ncbi:MAG: hypothetical protein ACM3JG_00580 [Thiohalocapsa sp.]